MFLITECSSPNRNDEVRSRSRLGERERERGRGLGTRSRETEIIEGRGEKDSC